MGKVDVVFRHPVADLAEIPADVGKMSVVCSLFVGFSGR